MAIIFIEDLNVETVIGAYHWEQAVKQKLLISLELQYDEKKAADTDDLTFAIDYAKVAEKITEFCENSQYFLIEKLAHELIALLKNTFGLSKIKIKIRKPQAISNAKDLGVVVESE